MIQTYLKIVFTCCALLLLTSCTEKTLLQYYENTPRGTEDIAGWEKVDWGMTVSEVQSIYPLKGEFKEDEGLFEPGYLETDGHYFKSHIVPSPHYWEKLPTVVSFYFDKNDQTGKLVRVKLMFMTQLGKIGFEQTTLSNYYRYIIRKHGWPYRFHPDQNNDATVYHWSSQSGMIQSRFTRNTFNDGLWNYVATTNYLSKDHPLFGSRYNRRAGSN